MTYFLEETRRNNLIAALKEAGMPEGIQKVFIEVPDDLNAVDAVMAGLTNATTLTKLKSAKDNNQALYQAAVSGALIAATYVEECENRGIEPDKFPAWNQAVTNGMRAFAEYEQSLKVTSVPQNITIH